MNAENRDNATDSASLAGVTRVIRRRRSIVAAFVLVVPLVAFLSATVASSSYQAVAQVLTNREDLGTSVTKLSDTTVSDTDADRYANTSAAIARSTAVVDATVRLSRVQGLTPVDVLNISTVQPAAAADVLTFTVRTANPAVSEAIANAYAKAFVAERSRLDIAPISHARAEAQERLVQLKASGVTSSPLYTALEEKAQQLATLQTLYTSRSTVLVRAESVVNVRPSPTQRTGIGLVIGLILGVLAAFVCEAFDTRVRSAGETGEVLGLPVLGRIPANTRRLARSSEIAMLAEPAGAQAESFRFLRSSIELLRADYTTLTVLVSSPGQGDGKSTVAANLAFALAQSGHRVALLDADSRRPAVESLLDVPYHAGVEEVARGTIALREALVRVYSAGEGEPEDGSLDVLLGRPRVAAAFERLAYGRAIAELRDDYDFVIVDGPPLLAGGEALGLSVMVDGLIVVCSLDSLRRADVKDLARILPGVPATKLGVVCTAVSDDEGISYGDGERDLAQGPRSSDVPWSRLGLDLPWSRLGLGKRRD